MLEDLVDKHDVVTYSKKFGLQQRKKLNSSTIGMGH